VKDKYYEDVVAFTKTLENCTPTKVQRHFKWGYNRAVRAIEQMEIDGIVSNKVTANGRKVIKHQH